MFHPISRNVIRQSFKLMGIPKPIRSTTLDQVKFPTDTVVTAYRYFWDIEAVEDFMVSDPLADTNRQYDGFVRQLRDCFCADIFPTDWDYDEFNQELYVTICTRFVQHNWE